MPDVHYLPPVERFARQSATNKQASAKETISPEQAERFRENIEQEQDDIYASYFAMLGEGVAKEVARVNTPISRYTRWWAKANLRNWLHFLGLRMAPGAQEETRKFANAIATIVRELWPRTWALFEEYDLYGARMSRTELAILSRMLQPASTVSETNLQQLDQIAKEVGLSGSKLRELLAKLS
jgi:thymidylate synthase (FAD)